MKKTVFLAFIFLFVFSYGVFADELVEPTITAEPVEPPQPVEIAEPAEPAEPAEIERRVNNISLSFGLFGTEISYERMFNDMFSLVGSISNRLQIVNEFTASAKARLYPFSGRVFYLEMGFGVIYGYGYLALVRDGNPGDLAYILGGVFTAGFIWAFRDELRSFDIDDTLGFLVQPGMGWNIRFGREDRFTLPISMGLNLKFGEIADIMPFFRMGLGYSF